MLKKKWKHRDSNPWPLGPGRGSKWWLRLLGFPAPRMLPAHNFLRLKYLCLFINIVVSKSFFSPAFLRNFYLWLDQPSSDGSLRHLAQSCCVALGWALICMAESRVGLRALPLGSSSQVGTRCGPWRGNSLASEKSIALVWNWTRVRCF